MPSLSTVPKSKSSRSSSSNNNNNNNNSNPKNPFPLKKYLTAAAKTTTMSPRGGGGQGGSYPHHQSSNISTTSTSSTVVPCNKSSAVAAAAASLAIASTARLAELQLIHKKQTASTTATTATASSNRGSRVTNKAYPQEQHPQRKTNNTAAATSTTTIYRQRQKHHHNHQNTHLQSHSSRKFQEQKAQQRSTNAATAKSTSSSKISSNLAAAEKKRGGGSNRYEYDDDDDDSDDDDSDDDDGDDDEDSEEFTDGSQSYTTAPSGEESQGDSIAAASSCASATTSNMSNNYTTTDDEDSQVLPYKEEIEGAIEVQVVMSSSDNDDDEVEEDDEDDDYHAGEEEEQQKETRTEQKSQSTALTNASGSPPGTVDKVTATTVVPSSTEAEIQPTAAATATLMANVDEDDDPKAQLAAIRSALAADLEVYAGPSSSSTKSSSSISSISNENRQQQGEQQQQLQQRSDTPTSNSKNDLTPKSPSSRQQQQHHKREVIYHEGGTPLFRAIEESKWQIAMKTAAEHPKQVRTWVNSTGTADTTFEWALWKRLPLHEACRRQAPAWLVARLLSLYPDSSQQTTQFGELPIHLSVSCGSAPEVVNLLIAANFRGLVSQDQSGRTPLEILQDTELLASDDHKVVYESLERGQATYYTLRSEKETALRNMKQEHESELQRIKIAHEEDLLKKQEQQDTLQREIEKLTAALEQSKRIEQELGLKIDAFQRIEGTWTEEMSGLKEILRQAHVACTSKDAKITALESVICEKNTEIDTLHRVVSELSCDLAATADVTENALRRELEKTERNMRKMVQSFVGLHETMTGHRNEMRQLLEARGIGAMESLHHNSNQMSDAMSTNTSVHKTAMTSPSNQRTGIRSNNRKDNKNITSTTSTAAVNSSSSAVAHNFRTSSPESSATSYHNKDEEALTCTPRATGAGDGAAAEEAKMNAEADSKVTQAEISPNLQDNKSNNKVAAGNDGKEQRWQGQSNGGFGGDKSNPGLNMEEEKKEHDEDEVRLAETTKTVTSMLDSDYEDAAEDHHHYDDHLYEDGNVEVEVGVKVGVDDDVGHEAKLHLPAKAAGIAL